ncbi:MAG TPA: PQQ-binding-like beta-propeller repeat protein, partial [Planctomycetia bacterium]|nr:PQQ-binding-like beta-propeller repeat protein [Planctomycetia bacterium]
MLKVAVTLLLCLASAGAAAENASPWPRFRGPNGSGVAEDQRPPICVGPEENVLWKVQTPPGLSSPIVLDDLLVMTGFDGGKLWTIAYRRSDGSEAWRAEAPAERLESYHPGDGSPAASTPATDGERIVSYFGSCGLFCYDKAGRELWTYPLPTAATLGNFGTGTSPLIEDGVVLLLRDGPSDSQLIALDVKSGAAKWRQPRTSRGGFSTPVIWATAAGKQVAAPGHGRLIGYDLQTGESRWFVEGMPTSCCASPVIANGDLYFAAWSPGAAGDADFKLPAFQLVLLADGDANGTLSREELAKSPLKDFFDVIDA